MTGADRAGVVAVSKSGQHRFSKRPCDQIPEGYELAPGELGENVRPTASDTAAAPYRAP